MDFENLLNGNLSLLEKIDPDLSIRVRDQGVHSQWTLVEAQGGGFAGRKDDGEGLFLHTNSLVDPVEEAAAWCRRLDRRSRAFIILGFGLGYHVSCLVEQVKAISTLVIIESSLDVFAMSMICRDLTPLLRTPGVRFLVKEDISDLGTHLEGADSGPFVCRRFFPVTEMDSDYYQKAQEIIEGIKYRQRTAARHEKGLMSGIDLFLDRLGRTPRAGP
jgi:hypothetical protein